MLRMLRDHLLLSALHFCHHGPIISAKDDSLRSSKPICSSIILLPVGTRSAARAFHRGKVELAVVLLSWRQVL